MRASVWFRKLLVPEWELISPSPTRNGEGVVFQIWAYQKAMRSNEGSQKPIDSDNEVSRAQRAGVAQGGFSIRVEENANVCGHMARVMQKKSCFTGKLQGIFLFTVEHG